MMLFKVIKNDFFYFLNIFQNLFDFNLILKLKNIL